MAHQAADDRYTSMTYRRAGHSGVLLPAVSLGLWHNFGDSAPLENQRAVLRRAFDRGVTHIDLANNYGPPYGSAEANFGTLYAQDFRPYRDELFIATKAGYDMWPGPYGDGGSRKYLLSSLDQSLRRTGLDHVDVFYSHRFDPDTPLEETMGALDTAVRQGKALYAGISNYSPEQHRRAVEILGGLGTPLLLHQAAYSMLDRTVEPGVLDAVGDSGSSLIAFSPLAQGLLTNRYLKGIPAGSRMAVGHFLKSDALTEEKLALIRALAKVAEQRGQTLAQLALAWILRDPRVVSVIIGASSVAQLDQNLAALDAAPLNADELTEIDRLLATTGTH
ncbi:aldo/keto reductase [Streptomyces sp. NPDC048254]|uniref:aldo/keto reductase n=1 Tax=Streptomyces sp. NPDC048254 TaxID=3365525 RepID=UPI00372114C9